MKLSDHGAQSLLLRPRLPPQQICPIQRTDLHVKASQPRARHPATSQATPLPNRYFRSSVPISTSKRASHGQGIPQPVRPRLSPTDVFDRAHRPLRQSESATGRAVCNQSGHAYPQQIFSIKREDCLSPKPRSGDGEFRSAENICWGCGRLRHPLPVAGGSLPMAEGSRSATK